MLTWLENKPLRAFPQSFLQPAGRSSESFKACSKNRNRQTFRLSNGSLSRKFSTKSAKPPPLSAQSPPCHCSRRQGFSPQDGSSRPSPRLIFQNSDSNPEPLGNRSQASLQIARHDRKSSSSLTPKAKNFSLKTSKSFKANSKAMEANLPTSKRRVQPQAPRFFVGSKAVGARAVRTWNPRSRNARCGNGTPKSRFQDAKPGILSSPSH